MTAALLLLGCESTRTVQPPYIAREVTTVARWQVASEGEVLGEVVEFEIHDPTGPIRFFRVLDKAGRWLGHATENGRFSRRVPFREDEEDLGVLAMPRGVGLLFEASAPVRLEAVPVDADWRPER